MIYEFNASFRKRDGWEGNSNFLTCGEIRYFGSTNYNCQISRIFLDLEPHSHIIVEAQILRYLIKKD
ncbi:unnamed protein product [Paramecium octaurelia]|uniref:Uncharacterized protein n=1 Tax=Paramecium octaurelia TaxID=43137 RepID=A0A8S1YLT4_PAROT|nr:unnamed protein product [Paramecium octaurelia]